MNVLGSVRVIPEVKCIIEQDGRASISFDELRRIEDYVGELIAERNKKDLKNRSDRARYRAKKLKGAR